MSDTNVRQLRPGLLSNSLDFPGYWAEFIAFHQEDGKELRAFRLSGTVANTSGRALAWLRTRIRRAAVQMEASAQRDAHDWLGDRRAISDALSSLANGDMYLHIITEDGGDDGHTHYEVTVRPVIIPGQSRPVTVMPLAQRYSA